MLHAFVDESERGDSFYFLGALIVSDSQLRALTVCLDSILARHAQTFPTLAGAELHASAIMRADRAPWRQTPLRVRFAILEDVLHAIVESGARVYIEGVNIARHRAKYAHPMPPRELAFSHLFERINSSCDSAEPRVRVIADDHHTAAVSRSNFSRYQVTGTYGYRSSKLANVDPSIDFIASETSRALQASDVVTYLFNRLMTVPETDVRAHAQKHKMWQIVEPATLWPIGRTRIWP